MEYGYSVEWISEQKTISVKYGMSLKLRGICQIESIGESLKIRSLVNVGSIFTRTYPYALYTPRVLFVVA